MALDRLCVLLIACDEDNGVCSSDGLRSRDEDNGVRDTFPSFSMVGNTGWEACEIVEHVERSDAVLSRIEVLECF